ncbi:MAG: class I SAM-dependent methyltransferase [Deltaproteobacteria bacterium]|nr:class I SAM-dependent methyltransferase [Deltaproteobacteria bacterium]
MIFKNIASYKPLESFLYDRIIAPAVVELSLALQEEITGRIQDNASLLDVGCGGGQLAIQLHTLRKDLSILGIDLSSQQIKRALRRRDSLGIPVEFRQGSALNLAIEDETFDLVFSSGSIKHWPDPLLGLKECLRVLKPGGVLLIFEVDQACTDEEIDSFVGLWRLPRFMIPLSKRFFRKFVSGRSFTQEGIRSIASQLSLKTLKISKVTNTIAWMMEGIKPIGGR